MPAAQSEIVKPRSRKMTWAITILQRGVTTILLMFALSYAGLSPSTVPFWIIYGTVNFCFCMENVFGYIRGERETKVKYELPNVPPKKEELRPGNYEIGDLWKSVEPQKSLMSRRRIDRLPPSEYPDGYPEFYAKKLPVFDDNADF